MSSLHHLSWENFRLSILVKGEQRVHRISESPRVEIFSDGGRRIGVWVESPSNTEIHEELSKFTFIASSISIHDGINVLEIATNNHNLWRQFYHFAVAVSERVVVEGDTPIDAAVSELHSFAELLRHKLFLGPERELGLVGELIFLERLCISGLREQALDAWTGPFGEAHDFRIQSLEFEVKTTGGARRVHTINSLGQMVPSVGCSLFMVSIQLGSGGAGAGFSLAEKVDSLMNSFRSAPNQVDRFVSILHDCGLPQNDVSNYSRRFVHRRPIAVVPVDKGFPSITRQIIDSALGSKSSRIEEVQYEVNVEGLGIEDGTSEFSKIISNEVR